MSIETSRQKVAENDWIEIKYITQIYEKKHKFDEILCCFHFMTNFAKQRSKFSVLHFYEKIEIGRSQPIFVQS